MMSTMVSQIIATTLVLSVAAATQTLTPTYPVTPPPSSQPSYNSGIATALATWTRLRQSDAYSFNEYARFLTAHPGFPGEDALRKTAERVIPADGAYPADVVGFFTRRKPLTAVGWARYAEALAAAGRRDEANVAARSAWASSGLSVTDEARLQGRFAGVLTTADHDARVERLLADRQTSLATRAMAWASPARRGIFDTRIALQTKLPDAESRVLALGPRANTDAGLLADRANWLRASGRSVEARNLLGQFRLLEHRPFDVEKWYETLLVFARGAAADRNWSLAYRIASQVDDAYPAGTIVSTRSVGERDEYTSLTWLAGTAALHHLGRPADAANMFEKYALGGQSTQVLTKGKYWAGRAASAAGQAERANAAFARAAEHPELFYGQLSAERLGRTIAAPGATPVPTEPEAERFARSDMVQAVRLLGQQGRWDDQSRFVRHLAEQAKTPTERALATNLAMQVGRKDLGVWVARSARNSGTPFYTRGGYPEVSIPAGQSNLASFANGIIRQESSFDRAATSHVGARGMMQLMPATARETASKLGLTYDLGRLTSDPEYNIQMGSWYLQSMMSSWGGNAVLAAASYNAGAGNVRKWVRENGDPRLPGADIVKWIEDIPFSETRGYVQRVLENTVVYDAMNPGRARGREDGRLSWYLGKNRPG
ncbi:MAG TPA: lytic transglycosylase domain-containing protein [Sphingomonadaceae bacterium]|nr:lytic transglycosylase domain-containing protein [Sphingomonadaceae bacterium]